MNDDDDDTVLLATGVRVLRDVYVRVAHLQALGHCITVDAVGNVFVEPSCDEDLWYVLDAKYSHTRACLEADNLCAIH
jgi:hypothetical protein